MGVWQTILLILKYFPIVVELVKKLEEKAEIAVLEYRIDKANKKIEEIFTSKAPIKERAKELNNVFNPKKP